MQMVKEGVLVGGIWGRLGIEQACLRASRPHVRYSEVPPESSRPRRGRARGSRSHSRLQSGGTSSWYSALRWRSQTVHKIVSLWRRMKCSRGLSDQSEQSDQTRKQRTDLWKARSRTKTRGGHVRCPGIRSRFVPPQLRFRYSRTPSIPGSEYEPLERRRVTRGTAYHQRAERILNIHLVYLQYSIQPDFKGGYRNNFELAFGATVFSARVVTI